MNPRYHQIQGLHHQGNAGRSEGEFLATLQQAPPQATRQPRSRLHQTRQILLILV